MIDAQTVERFQRDGAVCLRRLFEPEDMAVLRAGIDNAHYRRFIFDSPPPETAGRLMPRRWRTSPEFPGLAEELPAGSPMNHPLFPEVWRAP